MNFNKVVEDMWAAFGQPESIVVATSLEDRVTARPVSAVAKDGKIYFTTFTDSCKMAQIQGNSRVAVVAGAIQMTGIAKILGHPSLAENKEPSQAIQKVFPEWYAQYNTVSNATLVEIVPEHAGFGSLDANEMYLLDFQEQTAKKIPIN